MGCRELNDLMRKTGNWAPDDAMEHYFEGALWWRNGQIRDPNDDEIWPPDDLMVKFGPRPLILLKRFNTAPLHSFKLMGPEFKLKKFRWHASWKRIHGVLNLHCSFYISKIVWWFIPMFDFGIFCHLLDSWGMGIYRVGPPSGYLKSFVLPFLPFIFFFFLFYSSLFFLSLGGPWTLSTHATQSLRHCY